MFTMLTTMHDTTLETEVALDGYRHLGRCERSLVLLQTPWGRLKYTLSVLPLTQKHVVREGFHKAAAGTVPIDAVRRRDTCETCQACCSKVRRCCMGKRL